MNRISRTFRIIHLSLWGLFTFLTGLQLKQGNGDWTSLTVGFIATCLYVFYSHFYLLTLYSGKRKRKDYWIRLAGITLTGPLPLLIIHYKHLHFGYYSIHVATTVVIFLFLSWVARVTQNLFINTVKKEQLEKQAVEAELHYLKSQINPHFLFNTLNNIHTLVYKQAPQAPEAVLHLASLMRYMIYESNAPTVPLNKELDYLQDYIRLQQLRYKEAPVVDLAIEGAPEGCHIAPLLFIHLLENAYKHSPGRLQTGAIKVRVAVTDDLLTFSVENPVGPKRTHSFDEPGGIGLPNVRKRLLLLYPEQYTLDIHHTGDTFTVVLHIRGLQLQPHERKADLLYH